MNSVIEAQQDFTMCFGELCLSDLCGTTVLPKFSNEYYQMEEFIKAHQTNCKNAVEISIIAVESQEQKIYFSYTKNYNYTIYETVKT